VTSSEGVLNAARGARGRGVAAAGLFTIAGDGCGIPCQCSPGSGRVPCWLWRHERAGGADACADKHGNGGGHAYGDANPYVNPYAHSNADAHATTADFDAEPDADRATNLDAHPDTDVDADTDPHTNPNSNSDGYRYVAAE
jgi:hypothetical protein